MSVINRIGLKALMNKISEAGMIGEDGRLRMPMDRLREFFSMNRGRRVIVQFESVIPGSSEAQRAYYYNYIVPTFQAAMMESGERMTRTITDMFLIERYPGDKTTLTGQDATEGRELNQNQMSDYIDWLKEFGAEMFNVYIEDSRMI